MSAATPSRKPDWLKIAPPGGENYLRVRSLLKGLKLATVCEEARCPNVAECWGGGTATIMLMGEICTRGCRFCHVKSGKPMALDPLEPRRVAEAVSQLGLTYVVLTSVDRDDLSDGGAAHIAETVQTLKRMVPGLLVEVLIPDFRADVQALGTIASCGVDVVAHNLETVRRLTPKVRDGRASYDQSLRVLEFFRATHITKTSLMLGLGEQEEEVLTAMQELRAVGTQVLTFGQYLRPSDWHLPVDRFIPPDEFDSWKTRGEALGFDFVVSGPLVRSSYRAGEFYLESRLRNSHRERESLDVVHRT